MSRGTSKPKVVGAVLAGLSTAGDARNSYAIAEAVLRDAQPCRVDIGLELEPGHGKGRAVICREVRVLGLGGGVHATVIAADDAKPATMASALQALKATGRRRAQRDAYRMLALPLDGAAGLRRLHQAVERELGARARPVEVFAGDTIERAGRAVTPAVVVMS